MKYFIDKVPRWNDSKIIGVEIEKSEAGALLFNEFNNIQRCVNRLEVEGVVNLNNYVLSIAK